MNKASLLAELSCEFLEERMGRLRFDMVIENAIRDVQRGGDHLISMTGDHLISMTESKQPLPQQQSRDPTNRRLRRLLRPFKHVLRPVARYLRRYFVGDLEIGVQAIQTRQESLEALVRAGQESLEALVRVRQESLEALVRASFGDQSRRLQSALESGQLLHTKIDDMGLRSRGLVRIDSNTFAMRTYDGFVFIPRSDHLLLLYLLDAGPAGLEPGTRRVLTKILGPGMTFVDVGAHIGLLTLAGARSVGNSGRVFALEPGPAAFDALCQTIAMSGLAANIQAKRQAVGARQERRKFYIRSVIGHSSLTPSTLLEAAIEEVEIDVSPLDDIVPEGEHVDLVKIDVEGAELAVLAGMTRIIAENPQVAIIAEYGPSHLQSTGISPEIWFASFRDRGFESFSIDERNGECRPVEIRELIDVDSVNILFGSPGSTLLSRALR
jgi:FkbM family methyltransferase